MPEYVQPTIQIATRGNLTIANYSKVAIVLSYRQQDPFAAELALIDCINIAIAI